MYQDLHSHTYYSFCGKDSPETIVEAAIAGGLDVFGITDHNHGVQHGRIEVLYSGNFPESDCGRMYHRYFDHINLVKEKYADKIDVKRGIEICTLRGGDNYKTYHLPDNADISFFDYCIVEHLDNDISVTNGDIFSYAKRLGTPLCGIAHTDLFAHIEKLGADPLDYFKRMCDENIFWEMNVSYDSIHNYHEHAYVKDFFEDEKKQEIVRKSGARVSIGFDGHRTEDYLPDRIKDFNDKLTAIGIKKPFEK